MATTDDYSRIDVKDAIRRAKMQITDLLEGETYSQIGLEEVKYDDREDQWVITLGLNRPWNMEKHSTSEGAGMVYGMPSSSTTTTRQVRTYKEVRIDGRTGEFVSMQGTD